MERQDSVSRTGLARLEVTVNGRKMASMVEPRRLLADVLREDFGLTGTHVGCEHGVCGACTILWDGRPARSCLALALQADGADLVTVEGFSAHPALRLMQEAFAEAHGLQCGFCTPGILASVAVLLRERPHPGRTEITEALSGHLCRCTGYQNIVRAVQLAAERLSQGGLGDETGTL